MGKEDRGFASMDRAKQREIASKGGKAAHAAGTAHQWDSQQAREAGRKGGLASRGGRGKVAVTTDRNEIETAMRDTVPATSEPTNMGQGVPLA